MQLGIVAKKGNWYEYNGERLGNGLAQSVESLLDTPERIDEILKACREPKVLFRKLASTASASDDIL